MTSNRIINWPKLDNYSAVPKRGLLIFAILLIFYLIWWNSTLIFYEIWKNKTWTNKWNSCKVIINLCVHDNSSTALQVMEYCLQVSCSVSKRFSWSIIDLKRSNMIFGLLAVFPTRFSLTASKNFQWESGQFPDQSNTRMFRSPTKFLTTLLLWQATPLCMKMLHWRTDIRNCNLTCNLVDNTCSWKNRQNVKFNLTRHWLEPANQWLEVAR